MLLNVLVNGTSITFKIFPDGDGGQEYKFCSGNQELQNSGKQIGIWETVIQASGCLQD